MHVDFIDFIKTMVLLFLNTIIEFLPISSTAHGILLNKLIKIKTDIKLILAMSQMAILLALIYYFKEQIFNILKNFFTDKKIRIFCYNIIISTIPAVIFGLFFNKIIRKYFFYDIFIAIFLIIGGIIMIYINKFSKNKINKLKDYNLYDIPKLTMYKVGLCQAIALLPGISRSAATICGAIYYGLSKASAIDFSFFLSLPISFCGSVFDIFMNFDGISNYYIFLLYFTINMIFAIFLVKKLIAFLKCSDFNIFGYYRIIFGLVLLIFKFIGESS